MATSKWTFASRCLILFSLAGLVITFQPALADRNIVLEKKIDVSKESFCKTFTDLNNYEHVFPEFIKSVKTYESGNKAKFTINVGGVSYKADVKSTVQTDCKYVVDVISGDIKGTKIITTMSKTWGFDGTSNGGTIVKTGLFLKTAWHVDFLLLFVSDGDIRSALDFGIYKIAQYIKIN